MMPAQEPLVCVGITTRNRAHILPRALDSIRGQDYPNLSIHVIDDASEDETGIICARYPEVVWRRHDTPLGLIASRNELMRSTGAAYYVSLDDDAWFMKGDEIALAVECLERHPAVAAVAFDILSPSRPGPVGRQPPESCALFIGCGHVLRLSAVREAGYYVETSGRYGAEEKDLCLRLLEAGHRTVRLPGVHVWHEKEWSRRDWAGTHRSGVCNELGFALRRYPMPDVCWLLPGQLINHFRFSLGRPRFFWSGCCGLWDFILHLPVSLRSRSPVTRRALRFFRNPGLMKGLDE